uniref:Polymerase protein 3 n=1 Tax=Ornate chorus frog influenza-like virus TaxID=2777033 RepID=A0A866VYX2_9ORTO|nr:polymerase protein 3 [Ornate chorus frog influenza-like virus]
MTSVIKEVASRFLEPLSLQVAELSAEEYGDKERRIVSIGVHFQVCCMISDDFTLDDGISPRYEILEGRRRQEAETLQNRLCERHKILPLRFLADLFDKKSERFIEIGITKRENDEYFQEKLQKLGNSMDICIFTYGGMYFTNNDFCLIDEQKNRTFTYLSRVFDVLNQENMFNAIFVHEEDEPLLNLHLSKVFREMRDESVPVPFNNYEHLRKYCESYKPNKPDMQRKVVERMAEIKMRLEHLEEKKLRHLEIPKEKECPYTHKFLMRDGWFFTKLFDSLRSQPKHILEDFFDICNMSQMRTEKKAIIGKHPMMYSNLWAQIKKSVKKSQQEIEQSEQRDFLCGVGRSTTKIPESRWGEAQREEDFKQEDTKGPEKRGFPNWFNEEWQWAMMNSGAVAEDVTDWIPMSEFPPCSNEMEDYAKSMCEILEQDVQSTNCAREMSKLIMTVGNLHTECQNFPSRIKVLPIYARCKLKGERTDCLFGVCVKGKSHLNKDDGMYTVVTFEFSTVKPTLPKHEKYTVFEVGSVSKQRIKMTPERTTYLEESPLYLYCRTTGMSKLKNDWLSKCRRCLISTMETVEQMVLKDCALKGENSVREMMEKKEWIGHDTSKRENGPDSLVSTPRKNLGRMLLVMQFYYCIYNDNQLEGFCNEQKKFLMFFQADKQNKSAFTFNQGGLYEKIEECIRNNPMCLFLADRLNKLFDVAKLKGAKYFY